MTIKIYAGTSMLGFPTFFLGGIKYYDGSQYMSKIRSNEFTAKF